MEIILKESIRTLGNIGEVVKVKPGYARNFLFPQKKAVRATEENKAQLEKQRLLLEEENEKKLSLAKQLKASLSNEFVVLIKQASEDGRIFGSVKTREIAQFLSKQEYKIDHRILSFNGVVIKNLGEYKVSLHLHSEVIVQIPIHVVKSEMDANELRKMKLQNQKNEASENL
ncbi:50S ribosomal protein L9 [Wolbachia endosymbiont of Chironomus riparius]|uniref:50S ribosomal protein L9 n=1 Tax=Wolbachia endosymbiont of Chironomus riparius TaxID=2883238 RepID=UPI00351616CD